MKSISVFYFYQKEKGERILTLLSCINSSYFATFEPAPYAREILAGRT